MNERPILVASNLLVNERGELLLGRRTNCGLWETPGGKIEAESVVDGARREMLEETGTVLSGQPELLGYTDGWAWSGVKGRAWYVCLVFLWKEWSGEPKAGDSHTELRWFRRDELPPPEEMTYGTREFVTKMLPLWLDNLPRWFNQPEGKNAD